MHMHWTIYALLSAVFAALVAVFGKIGLKGVDSTLATTVRAVIMAGFLVIVSLFLNKTDLLTQLNSKALTFIALSGIAGALSWLFYFTALKDGTTSGVSAIDRTSIVFVLFLAILFLGEQFAWKALVGAIMITIGTILMVL
jgi:transporter family protein